MYVVLVYDINKENNGQKRWWNVNTSHLIRVALFEPF